MEYRQVQNVKIAPWCERCEIAMKMQAGYLMGGSHDWASYICECGESVMLHAIHDPIVCAICGPYTAGSPFYRNYET